MWTVLGLCTLLVLGGLRGASGSKVQIYGKSVFAGHLLGRRHDGRQTVRGQLAQARGIRKNSVHRSLDLEAYNIHVAPTSSKINRPTIIRLFPPTAKPLSASMPLRFGRNSSPSVSQPSNDNMPLRFGRDGDTGDNLPLRFGRDNSQVPNTPLRFGRDNSQVPNPPLRFGRGSEAGNSNSAAQWFGRSGRWLPECPRCSDAEKQLQGLFWSLLRTIHIH